jgi:hypothetical protein
LHPGLPLKSIWQPLQISNPGCIKENPVKLALKTFFVGPADSNADSPQIWHCIAVVANTVHPRAFAILFFTFILFIPNFVVSQLGHSWQLLKLANPAFTGAELKLAERLQIEERLASRVQKVALNQFKNFAVSPGQNAVVHRASLS